MSGNITQSSAAHAQSATRFEADGDWAQAAAEWQAAIDGLNPALGSANANAIQGYQMAIVNAVAGSRGAPPSGLVSFTGVGGFASTRTTKGWANSGVLPAAGTFANGRTAKGWASSGAMPAAGSLTNTRTGQGWASRGVMGGRGQLVGQPS